MTFRVTIIIGLCVIGAILVGLTGAGNYWSNRIQEDVVMIGDKADQYGSAVTRDNCSIDTTLPFKNRSVRNIYKELAICGNPTDANVRRQYRLKNDIIVMQQSVRDSCAKLELVNKFNPFYGTQPQTKELCDVFSKPQESW